MCRSVLGFFHAFYTFGKRRGEGCQRPFCLHSSFFGVVYLYGAARLS